MAHVIMVEVGEDVLSKILSCFERGPTAIYVYSAIGAVSSVTLQRGASSTNTVTHEGYFEIVGVSGSFMPSHNGTRTGTLSMAFAGTDGRVLGGGVAGELIAASPVQVIAGSFLAGSQIDPDVSEITESGPSSLQSDLNQAAVEDSAQSGMPGQP